MKFGEQLRSSIIREYQWSYIDYSGLKAELKIFTGPPKNGVDGEREWDGADEKRFLIKLDAELDKVWTKQQVKSLESSRRIIVSENDIKDVVSRLSEGPLSKNLPSEEEFMLLEEDVSDAIACVHDLAKFVQLNYTGFTKIIKKHDVRNNSLLLQLATFLTFSLENDGLAPPPSLGPSIQSQAVFQGKL